MFKNNFAQEDKAIDVAVLIPCRSGFVLHSKRANYVAAIMKRALVHHINELDMSAHGWCTDGTTYWIESAIPDDIEEILYNAVYNEHDVYGGDGDSDDKE